MVVGWRESFFLPEQLAQPRARGQGTPGRGGGLAPKIYLAINRSLATTFGDTTQGSTQDTGHIKVVYTSSTLHTTNPNRNPNPNPN